MAEENNPQCAMAEPANVDNPRLPAELEDGFEFVEADGFINLSDIEYQSSSESDASPRESLSPVFYESSSDNYSTASDGSADQGEAGNESDSDNEGVASVGDEEVDVSETSCIVEGEAANVGEADNEGKVVNEVIVVNEGVVPNEGETENEGVVPNEGEGTHEAKVANEGRAIRTVSVGDEEVDVSETSSIVEGEAANVGEADNEGGVVNEDVVANEGVLPNEGEGTHEGVVDNEGRATRKVFVGDKEVDVSETSSIFGHRNTGAFENQRLILARDFMRYLHRKDDILVQLQTQNIHLLKTIQAPLAFICESCHKVGTFCENHLLPAVDPNFNFFAGHETGHKTKVWLGFLKKCKRIYNLTDEKTIEVARSYLVGEASVWADNEVGTCNNWNDWETSFRERFLINRQLRRLTIESFANFLNYREVMPTQIFVRRVIVRRVGGGESRRASPLPNPLIGFHSDKLTLQNLWNLHQQKGQTYDVPEDIVQLNIVIKTRIEKAQDLDEEKINNDPRLKVKIPRTVEFLHKRDRKREVKKVFGMGPFAEPPILHPEREKSLKHVLGNTYSYYWTEWYLHLCLSNRITSKYGNPEMISVGNKNYMGYTDLQRPFSTMVVSAAVHKNYDIHLDHKKIICEDGRLVDSYSYFYEYVCLKPYNLTGRTKFRIVPNDSQTVDVIVGRPLTTFPLYYWDDDLNMPDTERDKMNKECEPEREYPLPDMKHFQPRDLFAGL